MKICYRRMSGTIGISADETGTRGAWWEKRLAFHALLANRGHRVDIVGRMSKASGGATLEADPPYDLMFIEFGGTNERFFGKDLGRTYVLAGSHRGPIVFLCDDPDLEPDWDRLQGDVVVWANALGVPELLPKQPGRVPIHDFPFAAYQPQLSVRAPDTDALAYLGRPSGRVATFKALANEPIVIFGRVDEWKKFPTYKVLPAPAQTQRSIFYNRQLGCLAVADAKHKRLAWRTGRAFHALLAGCPVLAEDDHPGLEGFMRLRHTRNLTGPNFAEWCERMRDTTAREALVTRERQTLARDREIGEATLRRFSL